MEKHKVFISFYHNDDEKYKKYIVDNYGYLFIDKSVRDGEYDSDDCDEYVKRLIREDKVSDSSVIVVLIGPNTYKRKHVDWEIYAGLRDSVNGCSGLVGVLLPDYPLYSVNKYNPDTIPARFNDNLKSGYSKIYSWTQFCNNFLTIIDEAFKNRVEKHYLKDNSRIQRKYNS